MKRLALIACLLLCACAPETLTAQARVVPCVMVTGSSMLPALRDGQVVALEQVPFADLKKGDVIVFTHGSGLIVHRIMEVRRNYVWTKGDANARPDRFEVHEGDVVGRVRL